MDAHDEVDTSTIRGDTVCWNDDGSPGTGNYQDPWDP
jgi:hypothetical protein